MINSLIKQVAAQAAILTSITSLVTSFGSSFNLRTGNGFYVIATQQILKII